MLTGNASAKMECQTFPGIVGPAAQQGLGKRLPYIGLEMGVSMLHKW